MIYYDCINESYEQSLKLGDSRTSLLIQALDHWENAVGEIKAQIVGSGSSLTISKGSGCRRSLCLSLLDESGELTPGKNSVIWYNRKLRLIAEYKPRETSGDTYRFTLGVFVFTSTGEQEKLIRLSGVDKYANLNGESRLGAVTSPFTTDISSGTILVGDLIRETLLRDIGNGYPIDPVPPKIDPFFDSCPLFADIALSEGQFYGELITRLAEMYGADCYYDHGGHLVFSRKPTNDQPYWFMHLGHIYRFKDKDETITEGTTLRTHRFDGVNCVTVTADSAEGVIVSYTAKNRNAESPVNVKAIGERYADPPIRYISLGDGSAGGEEKCREYAEYLLLQRTRDSISEDFTCRFIPHFDVDKVILYKNEDYVTDSLSVDLGNMTMAVKASSVAFLPMNWSVEGYE